MKTRHHVGGKMEDKVVYTSLDTRESITHTNNTRDLWLVGTVSTSTDDVTRNRGIGRKAS